MASNTPRHHKLWYQSSYDRGLDILLFMWPNIKSEYPDAELHIAYGWELFDIATNNNPERQQWKAQVQGMMQQEGIHHYGRLGKQDLAQVRASCGIWAYPTYFTEINCIGALEAQRDGLVPVVTNLAALQETVGSGVKVDGNINDFSVQEAYVKELIALMGDETRWEKESKKAQHFVRNYGWSKISQCWQLQFEKPVPQPKVSVITVTIREGFWGVMARNLARQSYKNFEWVILDDHKQNRLKTASTYAKKYGLNIRYIQGDKALGLYHRSSGLARANNKAWQAAKGELLVWLQDFILIPEHGIERLVDIYRHHPNDIIAPTDVYYFPTPPDESNKEDWWHEGFGLQGVSWRNVRNQGKGIRQSSEAVDFEMNWAATPRQVVEKINGWYEFFDDQMGFDNSEFALRAMLAGHKLWVDDANVATCLDLGEKYKAAEVNWDYWKNYLQRVGKDIPVVADNSLTFTL